MAEQGKTPHIVVVGSTMIDMITYAKRLPEGGETVTGDTFALGFGGKGANQAVMARRCGAQVTMVNTLGDDVFGDTTLQNFKEQGVDTRFIARVPGASGVAPIWVEPSGRNRIICVPGANNAMTVEQVESAMAELSDNSKQPNESNGIDVLIGQLEIPQHVTAAAFRSAQTRGIPTILNPAPFAPISDELISASDWIAPNESEFAALHPQGLQPSSDEIIQDFARNIGKRLLVTLGEAGAAYSDKGGPVIRVSAPAVTAVDTTGAGDSFVGAFAYALASGFSEAQAIQLGCLCASKGVTRFGTQSSYPTVDEAAELIRSVRGS